MARSRSARRARAWTLLATTSALLSVYACSNGGDEAQAPFPIASGVAPGSSAAVAWGTDRYLVTFGEELAGTAQEDVVGMRLTQDGEVIDPAPFLLSDFGVNTFLSADAVYSPGGIAFANDSFGVFVFGAGTIVNDGPPGQVIGFVSVPEEGKPVLPAFAIDEQESFSEAPASLHPPIAAAMDGSSFLVLYRRILSLVGFFSISEVIGSIVTPPESGISWQPIGPYTGIDEPVLGRVTSGSAPGVATNPSVTLAAWVQESLSVGTPGDVSTELRGLLFMPPPNGRFLLLSDTAAGSQNVAVASDGAHFLVVWTATTADDSTTLREVRAIRVTNDGNSEPEGGFLIEGGDGAKVLGSVVFAEGVYLVTGIEDGVVRGARLGTEGDDAEVFTINPGPAASVALATDGARFLAVFDRAVDTTSSDVFGAFVAVD